MAPDRVAQAVQAAWAAALPPGGGHGADTWREAGGDSLAVLHLMLELERRLGRPVPLDLMDADMTPAELAEAIRRNAAPGGGGPALVHLVPGAFGDEPKLAAFRRALDGVASFHVVDLPDVRAPASLLADMPATGAAVATAIGRAQADGALLIAGYSFGGGAAWEAAHLLRAAGRTVACVVVLDAFVGAGRVDGRHPGVARRALRRVTRRTGRIDGVRRAVLAAVGRAWRRRLMSAEWHFLAHFRGEAIDRWRPEPAGFPVVLVASDEFAPATLDRWRALAPGLRHVRSPGGHRAVLDQPPAREALAAALRPGSTG